MTLYSTLTEINKAIDKHKKNDSSVALLAASKSQDGIKIEQAIKAGVTIFGENKVQEAASKWPEIKSCYPSVSLHLIGPLQSNKAEQAVELFDVIQTIDRPKIAETLASAMKKLGKQLPCYIQVNTGKEPQKAGIMPDEADNFIAYCRDALKLPIIGLMCIPPHDQPPAPHFASLKAMAERNGLKELSMGMSEDYKEAIRMGATCIRLGRALFGERQ